MYFYLDPEVRVAIPIGDHVQVSLGLEVLVLFAISQPEWDDTDQVNAATDGIGTYGGEALTGEALVFFAPGIGVRAHF